MTPTLIKAWRWVLQPKVWRFVGFASAVAGLLCYALSSSFNYLFGNWNMLKIILYSIFSFIICFVILFAKLLQHSTSLWFKAHTAFLVLAITSAYSFFFDKVVNGKPDLYSLISCAAFAIMSLSLSRQTQFGFEIDLLYFFLGCLIVLLMKIKLQLFIVGAGFSYSLIILRSSFSWIEAGANNPHSDLQDGNSVVLSMASLQLTGTDIASANNDTSIGSPQLVITTNISSMMEQLQIFVIALRHENSNFIQMLLEHVKNYVEEYSELVVTDPNYLMDSLKPETIKGLGETAKVMMRAGFEKDFSHVYINCRRECLNECLMHRLFGLQKLSIEEVHNMPWNILEAQIDKWIKTFNVALKILFPGEQRLCDHIFFGSSSAADFSFMEICRGYTLQLLNYSESIATGSRSPERLFKMLEVLETLHHLIPEIESFFCDDYGVSLRNEANTIWKKLEEAIRGIFIELEDLIDNPSSLNGQKPRNMDKLEINLNSKSKIYDGSLGDIFLMKHGTCTVPITKKNELETLLCKDWIRQCSLKVWHNNGQYKMGSITYELAHEVNVKDSQASKGNEIHLQGKEASLRQRIPGREMRTLAISFEFDHTKTVLQDGFRWRKYGEKEILGYKYSRYYYRCTHRITFGCNATKRVQQLSDNPNVFEVRYYGGHSCNSSLIRSAPQTVNISKDMTTTMPPPQPSYYEWLSSGTPAKSINSIPVVKLAAPADGGYHPMMESIVCHLVPVIKSVEINDVNGDGGFSLLAQTEGTIELLESILASKSEKHLDPALRYFFMMNNWRYLEVTNQRKELDAIFGNVWFRKNREKVQQNYEFYQRNSWDKVLEFLKFDINDSMEISLAADLMKEKLRLFNMHFKETCRVQHTWSVHDEKLRGEIIASLKNILLPAYGIFIGKFQDILKKKAYNEYIEYGMFDIHDVLDILFLGHKKDS